MHARDRVGALGVLLGAAGGEHHRPLGARAEQVATAARSSATGTPVSRSTRSGQPVRRRPRRTSSKPVVRSSM